MFLSQRFGAWHRVISFTVSLSLFVSLVPALPAGADEDAGAIDPLQAATQVAIISPGQKIQVKRQTAPPITDNQFIAPALPAQAFQAFQIMDPQSKRPVSRDTVIVAPSGKRAKAGDYWDTVNSFEKYLNKRGQSLRHGKKFKIGRLRGSAQSELESTKKRNPQFPGVALRLKGTAADIAVVRALAPPPTETVDATSVVVSGVGNIGLPTPRATHKPKPKPTRRPNPGTLRYGFKSEGVKPDLPLPRSYRRGAFSDLHFSKSYNESTGSKGSAEFYLSESMSADGHGSGGQSMLGKVALGAYLLGLGGDVAKATASVTGSSAHIDIEALGQTIYQKSGRLPLTDGFNSSQTFFNFSVPIQVWILVVTISAGASGAIGINYVVMGGKALAMAGQLPAASIVPYLDLVGSFSASIGIGIADIISISVGLQGNLTIANVSLPLVATAGFVLKTWQSGTAKSLKNIYACRMHFTYALKGALNYSFLAGNVSGYLQGCFIFCATIVSFTIFNWNGITGSDTLFHIHGDTGVGDYYSDLPEYGYTWRQPNTRFSKDDSSGMPAACHNFYRSLGVAV